MPPLSRPFPRFISDSAQESRPYGRWQERLGESFAAACAELADEAGTGPDLESARFFPERTWGGRTYVPVVAHGAEAVDDVVPEFFGHVSFLVAGEGRARPSCARPPTSPTSPPPRTRTGRSTSTTTSSASGAPTAAAAAT